jgi:hypothetical protein
MRADESIHVLIQVKYMDRWRQEPSSKHNQNIKHEWARHGDSIQQVVKQTQYLSTKFFGMNLFLSSLKKPLDAIILEFSARCEGTDVKRRGSLLDTPIEEEQGMSSLDEQVLVEKIEGILQRLRTLKGERQQALTDLKNLVLRSNGRCKRTIFLQYCY